MSVLKLGVIGYGKRMRDIVKFVCQSSPQATLVAVADIRPDAVRASMAEAGVDADRVQIFADADDMLGAVALDGVLIGTRCDMHASMAVKVMRQNLPVFLEKPVATSMDDLAALFDAGIDYRAQAVVSFPLRVSPMVRTVRSNIDSGKIGRITHVQACNNVPYGSVYFQDWYRDESITGGLFLQKATHDFDYLNALIDDRPTSISAMTSKMVFRGDRRAGLFCKDCNENATCTQSPFNPDIILDNDWIDPDRRQCAFAVDTGNEDSGSALVRYESGLHLVYSQNFVARKKAAKRGATIIGYNGTIEFDWFTDTINVYMHQTPQVETIKLDSAAHSHGGGDAILARNFIEVIRDGAPSIAPLSTGLLSTLMCLKAKASAETNTFQDIAYPSTISTTPSTTNGILALGR